MTDEYFDALRRTGEAWDAYRDAASMDHDDANGAEGAGCASLWSQFQERFIRLRTLREGRRRG
jgi:hypothetical protein